MLGIKQEALAFELGDDWTQKKVSLLESKETIDDALLEQVANVLEVPVEAIKNFSEEGAITYFNNFNEGSINNGTVGSTNYNCNFNPIDKIVELYERMLKEKNELIDKLLNDRK